MGIPIPIEGLDAWLREIPAGSLVVLDGHVSPAPSFVAGKLAQSAHASGRKVHWLSTGPGSLRSSGPEKKNVEARPVPAQTWSDVERSPQGHDLVVDCASLVALDQDAASLTVSLRKMHQRARADGTVLIWTLEHGLLGESRDALFHHLADGVILFRSREDGDGTVPYLRVPKWPGRGPIDASLYYGYDGTHLAIDSRKRVV